MARKHCRPAHSLPINDGRNSAALRKQRWILFASSVAMIATCIALKSYVGNSTAEAQLFGNRTAPQQDATKAQADSKAAGKAANNLVLKAARALAAEVEGLVQGRFTLVKNLPVAAQEFMEFTRRRSKQLVLDRLAVLGR